MSSTGLATSAATNESNTETSRAETETGTITSSTSRSESKPAPSASVTQTQKPSTASVSHHSNNLNSNSISKGALAGAIIGSILGTALLTLLLAYFFFRRRRNQPPKKPENKSGATLRSSQFPIALSEKSTPGSGFNLAAITPQPADDATVRARILTLFDQAALHVDNYYVPGSSPTHLPEDAVSQLERYNSGYLPEPIEKMLGQKSVQRHVITHALTYTLLRAVGPEMDGGELLPKIIAAQPHIRHPSPSTDSALFSWRILTSNLYAQTQRNSTFANDDVTSITSAAASLAAEFTTAFNPCSFASFTFEERIAHLTTLAKSASDLGIWLFGQPCTFQFVWDGSKSESAFNITPKVIKTHDERGFRLSEAVVLVEEKSILYPGKI
ncbi:hypothetical protein BDW75DRAFT_228395 [Aspergillus navahoensis]